MVALGWGETEVESVSGEQSMFWYGYTETTLLLFQSNLCWSNQHSDRILLGEG